MPLILKIINDNKSLNYYAHIFGVLYKDENKFKKIIHVSLLVFNLQLLILLKPIEDTKEEEITERKLSVIEAIDSAQFRRLSIS